MVNNLRRRPRIARIAKNTIRDILGIASARTTTSKLIMGTPHNAALAVASKSSWIIDASLMLHFNFVPTKFRFNRVSVAAIYICFVALLLLRKPALD